MLNKRLDSIKAAREVEEKKMADSRAAAQEARSDIPALNVEKKELWEVRAPGHLRVWRAGLLFQQRRGARRLPARRGCR